ncbi:BatA aerotolerance operon protein [Rhodopirellula maiorica SM1]|uniref:BatA aerotolerance operon protein n=1 Tax=Rhodopirellula maiorica SM1 TaxID=1265738 RepID=M5RX91_9BACT|nr:VWA domain-containing protein [Rhodopirellula maiorica]EMI20027.1 BatA aerotolerance operon protein [Rhodopirellula maiorica SM1]
MSFAYPWLLLLLPVPVVLAWRTRFARSSLPVPSLKLWQHTDRGRARYLWLLPLLRVVSLMLLITALARPQAGSTHTAQVSEGIAIELLVDVSSSMDMSIQLPDKKQNSRMEVAKELVERFIAGDGEELQGREGDLLGLITFARYADTRSPLTFGHEALLQLVRDLEIQQRPNEDGTAYGDALAIAAARLRQLDDPEVRERRSFESEISSRVIILLTDGENNSGQHLPVEAAGLAKEWGCRVYCISLGDHAAPSSSAPLADPPLSEAERVLEHISRETGGIFRTAHDFESLLAVYSEVDQMERSRIVTRQYTRIAERFWLPLAASLLMLITALVLETTWLRTVP